MSETADVKVHPLRNHVTKKTVKNFQNDATELRTIYLMGPLSGLVGGTVASRPGFDSCCCLFILSSNIICLGLSRRI